MTASSGAQGDATTSAVPFTVCSEPPVVAVDARFMAGVHLLRGLVARAQESGAAQWEVSR